MQQRSKHTRGRILDAAVALFSEHGYEATSVAEICEVAGASKGAFYHHFPSKQELFLRILNQWLAGVDDRLFTRRKDGETVPAVLTRMAKTLGFVFQAASGQLPMFMEFMVQASRDETVWSAAVAPYRRYQQQFAELISQGQAEGSIRQEADPETTAQILISLAIGVLLQSVMDPGSADWEEIIKNGVATVVADIKRSDG
jgi:AcrR family transcriptional regulator